MKRKVLSFILAVAVTAALITGCGSQNSDTSDNSVEVSEEEKTETELSSAGAVFDEETENTETVQAEEVSVAVSYDVSDLAPYSSATSGRLSVIQTLYEYLAYYDSASETGLSGILMKECERLDNYTMRVTIYDYIYDSAGNHLTANDVAFSFNTWAEKGNSVK